MSLQTNNKIQDIFNGIDFDFGNLYSIADNRAKKRVNTYIEEWKDKGLLNGYFGILANNIYKRSRVKNSDILELLIYGAYIEEQSKLEEQELKIFKEDANYYYQCGQQEVNNALPKNQRKKVSVIPDAIFLSLLDMPNAKGYVYKEYLDSILKYNADQIYRQAIIDIQQQKPLNIDFDAYQNILKRQQNQRLNINRDKISGDVDLTLIGINNIAKSEGMYLLDKKAKVRFMAVEDNVTTKMCHSLNNQIFYVHSWNEFYRYSETNGRITKYRCYGLIQGLNLPPIDDNFHWCRSTLEYVKIPLIENDTKKEYNIDNPNYIRNINFTNNENLNKIIFEAVKILPGHIQELLQDTKFQITLSNSCYDRKNDIVYLLKDSNKYEILHEIGHLIETKLKLLQDKEYIRIQQNGIDIKQMSIGNIHGYDNKYDFWLSGDKFISEYQRMVYEYDIDKNERLNFIDYTFNSRTLGEYFSEGFRCYFENNKLLKRKDIDLYNYIKEVLK